ncbi:hypothetical protein BASA81_003096 [Batrachochytrium salamandrivorans]|nr:hypothetical protein BASA81_003096 [Batrachochytrium salamandrivorans]
MSKFKDLYLEIGLEVGNDDPGEISLGEINRCFKRTAKRFHPDKNPAGRARFESATDAVEVLRDPTKRAKFDHEYRLHQKELARTQADSQRTKQMRQDLLERERIPAKAGEEEVDLEALQRETLQFTQSARIVLPSITKRFSLEEHLARERVILKMAMKGV